MAQAHNRQQLSGTGSTRGFLPLDVVEWRNRVTGAVDFRRRYRPGAEEVKRTLRDENYLRWLEDADITIGKELRLEIAARLRELTA